MPLSYKPLFICCFLLFALSTYGQTGALPSTEEKPKPDDKTNDGTSSFKIGINYVSNNVFMGRTDTVRTPTFIPEAKYTFKSGIYFSGSLDFIPNRKKKKIDGGDLSAGYDFDINDNLSAGASYAKLFYSSNSTQIASAISSTFNANLTYDIGDIVSPTLSVDYNLNRNNIAHDVFINLEITHDFAQKEIFADADALIISPTATVNTGTQNFYDAYLTTKKIKNVKRAVAQNALLAQYINELGKYQLLDYELSVPVEYKTGLFIFHITPTYAIVENQLPKQVSSKISDAPSVFYFETGIALKF